MLKTESRVIDGVSVTCSQLPAMTAYRISARLGKMIGPALGALAEADFELPEVEEGADPEDLDLKDIDFESLAPALEKLLDGVANDPELVVTLLSTVTVRTPEAAELICADEKMINMAFGGKLKVLFKTIKFALEVNFSDFFGEGLLALNAAKGHQTPP